MPSSAVARPSFADRLRRDWYLTRFLLAMQDYPSKEYKRIRTDLRVSLDAAVADVGMRRALADLGSPSELAAGYFGQLDHPRPRYWDGAVVATLLGVMIMFCFLSYAAGAADTLLSQGGGTVVLHYLAAPLTVTASATSIAAESQLSWQSTTSFVGTLAAGFAIAARLWRLHAR